MIKNKESAALCCSLQTNLYSDPCFHPVAALSWLKQLLGSLKVFDFNKLRITLGSALQPSFSYCFAPLVLCMVSTVETWTSFSL